MVARHTDNSSERPVGNRGSSALRGASTDSRDSACCTAEEPQFNVASDREFSAGGERGAAVVVELARPALSGSVSFHDHAFRDNFAVQDCACCGARIAFRPPTPMSPARALHCKACGTVYFAKDDQEIHANCRGVAPASESKQIVAAIDDGDEKQTDGCPPRHVQRLVRTLAARNQTALERRKSQRYRATFAVVAVPLGNDFRIIGEPVGMTTVNISDDGAGLIHTRNVVAPYYALDFTDTGLELLQVVFQVTRTRPRGPAFEMGGRFVRYLAQVL
jgi:hypothetical protein